MPHSLHLQRWLPDALYPALTWFSIFPHFGHFFHASFVLFLIVPYYIIISLFWTLPKLALSAGLGYRKYWLASPAEKSVESYLRNGGSLEHHEVYFVFPEFLLEKMTVEERAAVPTKFKCSLYDDFEIALEDIFSGLLP